MSVQSLRTSSWRCRLTTAAFRRSTRALKSALVFHKFDASSVDEFSAILKSLRSAESMACSTGKQSFPLAALVGTAP